MPKTYHLISTHAQLFENLVIKFHIEISYRSDQSHKKRKENLKFNKSLLYDSEYVRQVKNVFRTQSTNIVYNQTLYILKNEGVDLSVNSIFLGNFKSAIRVRTISKSFF